MIFCYALISSIFSFTPDLPISGDETPFQIEKQKIHSQNSVEQTTEIVISLPVIKLQSFSNLKQQLTLGKTFSFGKYGDYFVSEKEIFHYNSKLETWVSFYKHELNNKIDFISLDPSENQLVILSGKRLLFFHLSKKILIQQFPLSIPIENPSSISISNNEIQIYTMDGRLITINKIEIFGTKARQMVSSKIKKQIPPKVVTSIENVLPPQNEQPINNKSVANSEHFHPVISTGFISLKFVKNEFKSFQSFHLMNPIFFQTLNWNYSQNKNSILQSFEKQPTDSIKLEKEILVNQQHWNWSATVGSLYDTVTNAYNSITFDLQIISPTFDFTAKNFLELPFFPFKLNLMSRLS